MIEKELKIGRKFTCHLGYFELPTDIEKVEVTNEYILFVCQDGIYEVSKYSEPPYLIKKVY